MEDEPYPTAMTEDEAKARSKRNIVLALCIVAFMGLIFTITLTRLKGDVAREQDWRAETGAAQGEIRSGRLIPEEKETNEDE